MHKFLLTSAYYSGDNRTLRKSIVKFPDIASQKFRWGEKGKIASLSSHFVKHINKLLRKTRIEIIFHFGNEPLFQVLEGLSENMTPFYDEGNCPLQDWKMKPV